MNVLILTPDAVGSTLLQRLLTIYMQFYNFGKPVINLHELTNGISNYYSPDFNSEILGKPNRVGEKWGYYQSLPEIVQMLESADHYKTSRLAQYHMRARQDSMADQIPFYRYLNENFLVISCRRRNLFEHSLSWALNKITKKLNVYSADEKINLFIDIYRNPINIDPASLIFSLDAYKNYINWCDNHFSVAVYFNYEEHMPNIEKFILDLPVFKSMTHRVSWNKIFGQDFNDWNRYHYITSDLGSLALDSQEQLQQFKLTHDSLHQPNTQSVEPFKGAALSVLSNNLINNLSVKHQEFVSKNQSMYEQAHNSILRMTDLGILPGHVPIKKQTLAEKRYMIKNFDQCIEFYNTWIQDYPELGDPVDAQGLLAEAIVEREFWSPGSKTPTALLSE